MLTHSDILLNHFRNPRNAGPLPGATVEATASNPACGDEMRLLAIIESGMIREIRYQVRGCTASIAAGSALTTLAEGQTVETFASITAERVEAALGGLIPETRHAAVLCADAVKALHRKIAPIR